VITWLRQAISLVQTISSDGLNCGRTGNRPGTTSPRHRRKPPSRGGPSQALASGMDCLASAASKALVYEAFLTLEEATKCIR